MPTDNVDKAYVKKHKINDMLNELFSELTSKKPENPVEFAIRHLESKLPPPKPEELARRSSSVLFSKIPPLEQQFSVIDMTQQQQQQQSQMPQVADTLFSKIFNRGGGLSAAITQHDDMNRSMVSSLGAAAAAAAGPIGGGFAFSTFNILNRLNRINVRVNKELSAEEMLEKENIVYTKTQDEEDEEKFTPKLVVTYKTNLKNRENALRHKNEIRKLVADEMRKKNDPRADRMMKYGSDDDDDDEDFEERENHHDKKRDALLALKEDEEQNEELNEQMLTARNYNRISTKEKPKRRKFQRGSTMQLLGTGAGATLGLITQRSQTPQIRLVICQICSRIQSNTMEEKNDFDNKDLLSGLEQPAMIQTAPILSAKEPLKADMTTGKEDEVNPFLKLFKASMEENKTVGDKKPGNADDDHIESASEVFGPRYVEPYEAQTQRSPGREGDSSRRESGVLAWVMARQQQSSLLDDKGENKTQPVATPRSRTTEPSASRQSQEKPPAATTERPASRAGSTTSRASKSSTLVGSKAGAAPATSARAASHTSAERKKSGSEAGSDVEHQAWRIKDSDSDVSSVTRKATQKKN